MPTLVTPVGHGAFPIDIRMYASFAFWYLFCNLSAPSMYSMGKEGIVLSLLHDAVEQIKLLLIVA